MRSPLCLLAVTVCACGGGSSLDRISVTGVQLDTETLMIFATGPGLDGCILPADVTVTQEGRFLLPRSAGQARRQTCDLFGCRVLTECVPRVWSIDPGRPRTFEVDDGVQTVRFSFERFEPTLRCVIEEPTRVHAGDPLRVAWRPSLGALEATTTLRLRAPPPYGLVASPELATTYDETTQTFEATVPAVGVPDVEVFATITAQPRALECPPGVACASATQTLMGLCGVLHYL